MTTVTRVLKTIIVLALAASLASCASARRILPFGLGDDNTPQATASEGQRISILSFEQQLAPSACPFPSSPKAAAPWPAGSAAAWPSAAARSSWPLAIAP